MPRTVHIIGAGLSGLSAAVRLAARGLRVAVYEATQQAGGRCRSYRDTVLNMEIDNGNHLLLSGNRAALAYLDLVGARDRLTGPGSATFPFVDLKTGARWTLRANDGVAAWWIFSRVRRVPDTRAWDYLAMLRPLFAARGATLGEAMACQGPLYERLIEPVVKAALNTDAPEGSAALAAAVIRETMLAGGRSYHPLVARDGLSAAFVDPALQFIAARDGTVAFSEQLHKFVWSDDRVAALDFGSRTVALAEGDAVVLAVPSWTAATLVPNLSAPTEYRAIVNAHYRVDPPVGLPPITGVVNGTVEWLFAYPRRLSVTISAGDRLVDLPREQLAERIWQDVAQIAGIASPMPPWQIVRERRATFAALPREDAKRPAAPTAWRNLVLAGDWTATGLPATIEGAIRSGNRAAELIGDTT